MVRDILPAGLRQVIRSAANGADAWKARLHLARLRRKAWRQKPGAEMECLGYTLRINDGPNFYIMYKDIFLTRIYHFEAQQPEPRILDCGSNIGMSILYFKHVYPQARIIGFEPDPSSFQCLQENVARNRLTGVQLVHAAIAGKETGLTFYSDGKYGGCLAASPPSDGLGTWTSRDVRCVRLRDYLAEPVDFLKMNIEGAEYEVLAESADRLPMVREMVIEYHHLPGLPRTLHKILALLDAQGFEYLVNDFDAETNGAVRPPFRLTSETRYFLLIYGRRVG